MIEASGGHLRPRRRRRRLEDGQKQEAKERREAGGWRQFKGAGRAAATGRDRWENDSGATEMVQREEGVGSNQWHDHVPIT